MTVSVNPVARQDSDLDQITKALNIATSIYGVFANKAAREKNEELEALKLGNEQKKLSIAEQRQANDDINRFATSFTAVPKDSPMAQYAVDAKAPVGFSKPENTVFVPSSLIQKQEDMDFRREQLASNERLRQEMISQKQQEKEQREIQKKEDKIQQQIAKFGGDMSDISRVHSNITDIEKSVGFDLDNYNPDTNEAVIAGQKRKVDIPGFSVQAPFIGGRYAVTPEGRMLQSKIQKIFNIELKDRSGAAVTTPEMNRLKEEFASGNFNTEEEMLGALKQYKTALKDFVRRSEAQFSPEALAEFKSRGGFSSEQFQSPSFGLPRGGSGEAIAAPSPGFRPGQRIQRGGKVYIVGPDGKTATEVK